MGEGKGSGKGRWLVPAVPFALSLAFSLFTVGDDVFWQDSGFFLTGVKELGVLYPHGFVLYLLLCKLWTLAFFFLPFTLAVHLFSSFCAALAAGTIAVAARDLLRSRGPLFGTDREDPGPAADWSAAAAGSLAASGYTFWFSAIYAKGYAFYFLVLALLLWRMIRADETGKGRDFTLVALLIGLAWQAHPSATLAGPALLLFCGFHRRAVGWKGFAARTGLAALVAAGPVFLLPLLAAGEPITAFDNPRSLRAIFGYFTGERFTGVEGGFGIEGTRVESVGRYFWEEFLGVGLVAVAAGLIRIGRASPRLLLGLAAWVVPLLGVTVLFKMEGQHDFWFVAAWIPLHLAAAAGFLGLARRAGRWARPAVAVAAALAVAWAVSVNGPLLSLRRYDLASTFGRVLMGTVDPGAVLVLTSDDAVAVCQYLQIVRGYRPDVLLVRASHLGPSRRGGPGWYDRQLMARHPGLKSPEYELFRERFPDLPTLYVAVGAFARANLAPDRPFFLLGPLPPELLPESARLVPAGTLWKLAFGGDGSLEAKYWTFPVDAREIRKRYGRERGQRVVFGPSAVSVFPEPYERRLVHALLRARRLKGDWHWARGEREAALREYEEIRAVEPAEAPDPALLVDPGLRR